MLSGPKRGSLDNNPECYCAGFTGRNIASGHRDARTVEIASICIGSVSALVCWFFCAKVKQKFKYDDSLDVFGVHGVGGFIGTVLVAVFASPTFGGLGYAEGMTMGSQLTTQLLASLYTILLSGVVSVILLKVIDATIGLRVDGDEENQGLDLAEHGESGYNS